MKILLTGVAGFIGSNLAEKLVAEKYKVVGIDNFDTFYSIETKKANLKKLKINPHFNFIYGDIRDSTLLNEIFSKNKFDIVVHLAAKPGVRPSIEFPEDFYDVNIRGTLILFETMKKHNVKKMIYASSSSVYGNNQKIPFSENDNVDCPISPYAATKKAGELIAYNYHHLYGFDVFCLRFFTVYGPRQRPDLAIHKFTNLILSRKELTIYGAGETTRDYTYIDDILNGLANAILRIKNYEIVNLGGSNPISLYELINLLEEEIGIKANKRFLPLQKGDALKTFADITKAKKILNFNPVIGINEGIRRFLEWKKL